MDTAGMFFGKQSLLLTASIQLDEHRDFPAQDVGLKRLRDVIDGAELISFPNAGFVRISRGYEDDRCICATWPLPDQPGGFEAGDLRHLDVQQDERSFVV